MTKRLQPLKQDDDITITLKRKKVSTGLRDLMRAHNRAARAKRRQG